MVKKSKRISNFIMPLIISLLISVCSFSFTFTSKAIEGSTDDEFYVNYAEPTTDEYSGYLTVVYYNTDNKLYYLYTYFWNILPSDDVDPTHIDTVTSMFITLTDSSITFTPVSEGSDSDWFNFLFCEMTDRLNVLKSGYCSKDNNNSYTFSFIKTKVVAILSGGNIASLNGFNGCEAANVHWNNSPDGLEMQNILQLIFNKLNGMQYTQGEMLQYICDIYNSNLRIEDKLSLFEDLYEELIQEQKTTNNWLQKIWQSIQDFFTPNEEEQDKADQFDEDSKEQADDLNDLNDENKFDKPDPDDTSDSVDENLNMDDTSEYSGVLGAITNNEYVLQMLLVSFSLMIVAFVFFGKR